MTLVVCSECNSTLSDQARRCPHCGAKNTHAPMHWFLKVVIGIVIAVAGFTLLGVLSGNSDKGREAAKAREVIRRCEGGEAARPGACQPLRDEYRRRYGGDPW